MRFLLDENIPRDLAVALREEGHNVIWVPETAMRGANDDVPWRLAARERQVLVTADLGFPLPGSGPSALIVLRHFDRLSTALMAESVSKAVRSLAAGLLGQHVTVAPGRIRSRPLKWR
ncbi:MAG: DUF5615 family PIN-like protein [Dehalococcoidia bacterium]